MSKGSNVPPYVIEEMKQMRRDGKSIREVAKKYGLSMSSVARKTKDVQPPETEKASCANMEDLLRQWDYLHERYGTKKGAGEKK